MTCLLLNWLHCGENVPVNFEKLKLKKKCVSEVRLVFDF